MEAQANDLYANSPNKGRTLENVKLDKNYSFKGPITPQNQNDVDMTY